MPDHEELQRALGRMEGKMDLMLARQNIHNERIDKMDGRLREVRPSGSYTVSPASEAPHREGGGAEDAIVLFSMRPEPGQKLYEILADDGTVIADITLDTLRAIRAA